MSAGNDPKGKGRYLVADSNYPNFWTEVQASNYDEAAEVWIFQRGRGPGPYEVNVSRVGLLHHVRLHVEIKRVATVRPVYEIVQ